MMTPLNPLAGAIVIFVIFAGGLFLMQLPFLLGDSMVTDYKNRSRAVKPKSVPNEFTVWSNQYRMERAKRELEAVRATDSSRRPGQRACR